VNTTRNHYLRGNKGERRPSRILFFDVESTLTPLDDARTQHTPRLICASYLRLWRNGRPPSRVDSIHYRPESFWDELERRATPKHPLYAVAHNLNYDLGVLAWDQTLIERGWTLAWMYTKGVTHIIRMTKDQRKIVFVDNMNWFKCSLAVLGTVVGLPKLDTNPLEATDAELLPYCQRDVEIMIRAWMDWFQFIEEHHLGNWGMTAPSQAFKAFRHRFLHHNLLVHDHAEALALERAAYHGGRTSVFWQGDLTGQIVYALDINSAYPAVMQRKVMPSRLRFYTTRVSLTELHAWLTNRCIVADVELHTDGNPFPVTQHGHNVYPIGSFRTTLSTPELQYALAHDWITHVHSAAVYEAQIIFRDFVTTLYALRQKFQAESNVVYNHMVKLLLNGLYGKFGQTASSFVDWGPVDDVFDCSMTFFDAATGKVTQLYRFGDRMYAEEDKGETSTSMPAIASHVTAYVRMWLYELREKAGRDQTYYCDTDSLFVTPLGKERLESLINPNRLGMLKVENVSDRVRILAPKCYRWGNVWTRKGVPNQAVEGPAHTFTFTRFPTLRGMATTPKPEPFCTALATRTLNYTIYDGTPSPNGWILPLRGDQITPPRFQNPQIDQRVWEIDVSLESIQTSRLLPPSEMLRLWDYRRGDFRNSHDRLGNVQSPEYSTLDDLATELGFADLANLQHAVSQQLAMDHQTHDLQAERKRLLDRYTLPSKQEPVTPTAPEPPLPW